MAQGTAVHLNSWHLDGGVAAEDAAKLSQRIEHFGLEKSFCFQRDIERLYTMTFRQNETVALWSLGGCGVQVLHHVEIECRHHIEARQIAADMARLGAVDNLHQALAVLLGDESKFFWGHVEGIFMGPMRLMGLMGPMGIVGLWELWDYIRRPFSASVS